MKQAAADIQPVLIALDTAADMFGGNENDRGQVRQFIGLLRGLAIAARNKGKPHEPAVRIQFLTR